jgi:hypothetical protein
VSTTCVAAMLLPASSSAAPWNPLARPRVDSNTLYLLNATAERKLVPGEGGLIASHTGGSPFSAGLSVVRGRFLPGLANTGSGWAWMPTEGMISADQFTVEMWLRSDLAWSSVGGEAPFAITDGTGSVGLVVFVSHGAIEARFAQDQQLTGPTSVTLVHRAHISAGKWAEVAVTFARGTLRLYLNGRLVAKRAGVVGPEVWSDSVQTDGIDLLGAPKYGASPNFALSDLRISRYALTPHQGAPGGADTATVTSTPTGATVQRGLLGVLHAVGYPPSPAAAQIVGSNLTVVHTDHLLEATPIVQGPPDATHPIPGVSGQFSYDWQVVDRSLAYIKSLGAVPYLSIDPTPSILGGSVPPFSGSQLTSGLAFESVFPTTVPNNMSEFATIVRDLVYHIVVQDGSDVPYWGVWNEPDFSGFWNGTLAQYVQMYAAVAQAVKSVSPSLQVGGPEVSNTTLPFFVGFLRAVVQQHLPLDFVSFHDYLGSLGNLFQSEQLIDATLHRSNVPLIVGEWGWNVATYPNSLSRPWGKLNYWANDWAAAYGAATLMDMQKIGAVIGVYTNGEATASAPFGLTNGIDPEVTLNVYRLWSQLGSQLLDTVGGTGPGLTVQASRDSAGRVYVLLSHLRYREDLSEKVRVTVQGVAANAPVVRFEIDKSHGDLVDAGPAHSQLTTVPAPPLKGGAITLTLPPRAVALLEIGASAT